MCGEGGKANVLKIILSIVGVILNLFCLACIIVSLALYWYEYKADIDALGTSTHVTFYWNGWDQTCDFPESSGSTSGFECEGQTEWDPSTEPRLFSLYIICLIGTCIAGLGTIVAIIEGGVVIAIAVRGAINTSAFPATVVATTVIVGIIMTAMILIFLAHPTCLRGDVNANSPSAGQSNGTNKGVFGIVYCSLGNTDLDLCYDFNGSQTFYGVDYSWNPGPGWALEIVGIPFVIASTIIYIIIAVRCCEG